MDSEKLAKLIQGFALPVTAVATVLTALAAAQKGWLDLFGDPHAWSRNEWLFLAAAAIVLLLVFAWSRRGQRSRLLDPDALRLDPQVPEQLVGRTDDLNKLANALNVPLVFLVGESGSGKSALLRAGVVHDPAIKERFLPLYLDM